MRIPVVVCNMQTIGIDARVAPAHLKLSLWSTAYTCVSNDAHEPWIGSSITDAWIESRPCVSGFSWIPRDHPCSITASATSNHSPAANP